MSQPGLVHSEPTFLDFWFLTRVLRTISGRFHTLRDLSDAVREWQGVAMWVKGREKHSGHTLSTFYVGSEEPIHLLNNLYADYGIERQQQGVWMWTAPRRLVQPSASLDLVVGDLPWPYYMPLADFGFLHVPGLIGQKLALQGAETLAGPQRNRLKSEEFRRVKKWKLSFRLTNARADLEHFYDAMYIPYIQRRFAESALTRSRDTVVAAGLRGTLLQVLHEGRIVAATVLMQLGKSMHCLWLGVTEGLDSALESGALSGVYYFSMQYAQAQGCEAMDLGYCSPRLNDRTYRHKRRWGASVHDRWHLAVTMIRPMNLGPAVEAFLANQPVIVRQGGGLVGKVLVADEGIAREGVADIAQRYAARGMRSLKIFATRPLAEDVTCAAYSELVPVELFDLTKSADPVGDFCAR